MTITIPLWLFVLCALGGAAAAFFLVTAWLVSKSTQGRDPSHPTESHDHD